MRIWRIRDLAALAVAGLAAHAATAAHGDDGLTHIRVIDMTAPTQIAPAEAAADSGSPPMMAQPLRYNESPYGHHHPGYGPPMHRPHLRLPKALALLSPFGKAYPPGHGWSQPARYPIYRLPVHYQQYWPNFWYGQPGVYAPTFPMVYQPTDTTQLGFYYQRSPYWQPNPAMVPQFRPWPEQWHYRKKPMYGSGFPAAQGHGYGHPGAGIAPIHYAAPVGAWPVEPVPADTPAQPAVEVHYDAPSGTN